MRLWYLKPFKLITNHNMANALNSDHSNVLHAASVNCLIKWSSVVGTGGLIRFEVTNDDVKDPNVNPTWVVDGTTVTINTTSGVASLKLQNPAGAWLRVAYVPNAITAGTLNVTLMGRGV
jgi:hypothetical protein